jgi:hypothetical protein
LGHTWQFDELEQQGLVVNNVELIQLSFYSSINTATMSFVDEGIWCSLNDGRIFRSLNYRPYRAAKYIKEDDSYFEVLKTEKLAIYPGDTNNRIRWENSTSRKAEMTDFSRVKSSGNADFSEVLKQVKNILKNPLGNKYPLVLVKFASINKIGDSYAATDLKGQHIVMEDNLYFGLKTSELLKYLKDDCLKNQVLLVRFFYDIDRNFLQAQPLSVVTDAEIIRLVF